MSDVHLLPQQRQLTLADAPRCLALSQAVNWTHDLSVWERLIALSGEGSQGVSVGDAVVSSNIALRYSPALAWIGLVITHPAHQRRGYGKLLMETNMAFLERSDTASILLDATEAGRPMYESFGFRGIYQIEVWEGIAAATHRNATGSVRRMRPADFAEVVALDAALFGLPRPGVLEPRSHLAWVTFETGKVTGYLLAQQNGPRAVLGPWYHPSPEGAAGLLRAAIAALGDHELRLNIPETMTAAKVIAESCGLTYQRACTRMLYGAPPIGHMAEQYATASFATG